MTTCRQQLINDGNKAIPRSCPTCKFGPCKNGLADHHVKTQETPASLILTVEIKGERLSAFTLRQALYFFDNAPHHFDCVERYEKPLGFIEFPDGSKIHWNGIYWTGKDGSDDI